MCVLAHAAAGAVVTLCGSKAAAQESTALDRFDPAPAGDAFFSVPSASVPGKLAPGAAALLSYARDPLSLRRQSDEGDELTWVSRQVVLHVLVSMELFERVKLDLDVPVTVEQGGTSGTLGTQTVTAPSGAQAGDLRVGGRVALLGQDGAVPAAALRMSVWLPGGGARAFSGTESARFAPALVVGGEYPRWLWSATFGGRFVPASEESLTGGETFGGVAAALRLGGFQIGPELMVAGVAGNPLQERARSGVSAEGWLGARVALGPVTLGLGGGPGFGRTPGTPAFRLFGGISVAADLGRSRERTPVAGDAGEGDGARRDAAKAVGAKVPERAVGVAPVSDQDGDGVVDADDACPALVGVDRPPRRGCPPDQDGDRIVDADDRCPAEAGVASTNAERHGCPADTDGDGIVDARDACPSERGEATQDPQTHGCPRAVRVEGSQIVLLQQVNFATGKAEILKESFDLLQQVVRALEEHPEIARVAVDGHTDGRGSEKANLDLSRRRALSVVQWLIEHGVDARRLESRGFGPRRPLADNTTDAGRAKNRRVEFQIRRRTAEGAAGWRDGPVDED
ncbi:OmpA family protein [Chondromyces apiculatus DSM 436]|uniref:OmpA family protein n=1 Tax=Chondromyces apiculatus DSM 436 TaxID=1192034 RepID=A0A017TC93_9BACT|nr:OmpA family protein [Chondromyces apiculatus DSM 436]